MSTEIRQSGYCYYIAMMQLAGTLEAALDVCCGATAVKGEGAWPSQPQ
jgi:hypothetical protein